MRPTVPHRPELPAGLRPRREFLKLSGLAATALTAGGCAALRGQRSACSLLAVDPLVKVFRTGDGLPTATPFADVARGEHATFQFVFRAPQAVSQLTARVEPPTSGRRRLGAVKAGWVGYVPVGKTYPNACAAVLKSPDGAFPDPILEDPTVEVAAGTNQPVGITVFVPPDAEPGVYRGALEVRGTGASGARIAAQARFQIRVWPATVRKTRLWVTQWWSGSPASLAMIAGHAVESFSPEYWSIIRIIARQMAAYRQNVALISPLDLAQIRLVEGRYRFDFSRFDSMVEVFREEGVIGRIEGGHLGGRADGGWTSQFVAEVPVAAAAGGGTIRERLPPTDPRLAAFYGQYLPALWRHLQEKGWAEIYTQHLADEPIANNAASYLALADLVKRHAPDLRIVEACHTKNLDGRVQVWVPQLNYWEQDLEFYRARQAAGDEVWFYTCMYPRGEYPNRFLEQPLIQTRLLHWLNFRYGATGYLHWGWNQWRPGQSPFGPSDFQNEGGGLLPAGDSWIVYPKGGRLLSSIRLEAMRDGLVDHELLSQLDAVVPAQARHFAETVVPGFRNTVSDPVAFRRSRQELLAAVSQHCHV